MVLVGGGVQRGEGAGVHVGRAPEDALEREEAPMLAVDHALQVAVAADGPGERHGLQAELALDVVQDAERLDAGAVGLVGERDHGQARGPCTPRTAAGCAPPRRAWRRAP
jgi:hypothetical protein